MQGFMTQIEQFCKWRAAFLSFLLPACFSHVQAPSFWQKQLNSQVEKQSFWLKQSLYAGPFYDDNRYQLLHPRNFEELTYLKTIDGDYILPPPSSEIIPAGTRIEIQKIEWPTGINIFKRPLLTPRYWPWVYTRLARARGPVTIKRDQTYIFILPNSVIDEKSFTDWKDALFSKDNNNEWIMTQDEKIRDAIFAKKPLIGMDYLALFASMGHPDSIKRETIMRDGEKITKEIVIYGTTIVILEDSKVTTIGESKN
jgi:hypothetical protein